MADTVDQKTKDSARAEWRLAVQHAKRWRDVVGLYRKVIRWDRTRCESCEGRGTVRPATDSWCSVSVVVRRSAADGCVVGITTEGRCPVCGGDGFTTQKEGPGVDAPEPTSPRLDKRSDRRANRLGPT